MKFELVAVARPLDVAVSVNAPWVPSVTLQPANVATPAAALTGLVVHASVPVPEAIPMVTAAVLVVTTSPEESSIFAAGWVVRFAPPVEAAGWVVNATWLAAPGIVKRELVAEVRPLVDADSVNEPWVPSVTLQPANVATPATALRGLVVHASVPAPVAIASVTDAELVVSTSPEESSIFTTGWTPSVAPPVDAVGCVVKATLVGVPATLKAELDAAVSPLDAADSVKFPCVPSVMLQPVNVATPLTALTGSVAHPSVPVPVAIASVTDAVLVVTRSQ